MRRYMIVGLGLLVGLGAAWAGEIATTAPATQPGMTEAIKGNPRILKYGKAVTLRWDATDGDLAQLGDGDGIEAVSYGGWPSGGPAPRITDEGLAHLARWKDLKEVMWISVAWGNRGGEESHITDAGLKHLSGLKNLRKLVFIGQKITDTGVSHLAALTNLQELWLDFTPALTDAGLAHLRELTNLKVLRLYGAAVTDSGVANLSKMTQLEDLQLGRSRVSDKGMDTIGGLKKLKTLDLQHTLISDKGLRQIEGSTQLTWLCLKSTGISDGGLTHLERLSRLEWLSLEGTKVTGEGLKSLKALKNLRVLSLDNTAVGDEGVETLLSMPAMERLKLNRTRLTDAGLLKLAAIKTLRDLEVEQTSASAEGLARFRQAAPTVSVRPDHIPPPPTPPTPGELDVLERQSYNFMKDRVLYRLEEWRDTQPKTAAEMDKYVAELVINLGPPEVLLKDGTDRLRRAGLSTRFAWTVYRVTPEGVQQFKAPARLKLSGLASQANICKEVFVIQGRLEGGRGVFVDIVTHGLRFSTGKGVANLAAYRFPSDAYSSTPDSITQSLLIAQPGTSSDPSTQPAGQPATAPATQPEMKSARVGAPAFLVRLPQEGVYETGDWRYEYRQAGHQRHHGRLTFKDKPIVGAEHYDRVETPWGTLIYLGLEDAGFLPTMYRALTLEELKRGRDLTPPEGRPTQWATGAATQPVRDVAAPARD